MSSPIYWIDATWLGRLGILPRPRGGDWLEVEIQSWKRMGLNAVVSLLTTDEILEFSLENEAKECQSRAIEFFTFEIPDRGVPHSQHDALKLLQRLHELLSAGHHVGLHCRQGIGRSGLMTACLLMLGRAELEDAVAKVSLARGCEIPETAEQRAWLTSFAASLRHTPI